MGEISSLDPSLSAPQGIKELFKQYQKLPRLLLDNHPEVFDFSRGLTQEQQTWVRESSVLSHSTRENYVASSPATDAKAFEFTQLPGKLVSKVLFIIAFQ